MWPAQLATAGTFSRATRLFRVLGVGDKAPDFKLPTTGNHEITLADALAKHKSLVFLFYVLDFTGG
jgi:peroxiredoxin